MNVGITNIRIIFYFKTHMFPRTYEIPVIQILNYIRQHKHCESLFLIKQFAEAPTILVIEGECHSTQHESVLPHVMKDRA
jgi:hypothetical protein